MPTNGTTDPGYGPPPGMGGNGILLDDIARMYGGAPEIAKDDPAFQQPRDATDEGTKQRASLVYRDLPLVSIQNTWAVDQTRGALYSHMAGMFDASAQLWDAILGDDRVVATLGSRISGLFGREVRFKPADDSDAAKECLEAWEKVWPRLSGDAAMTEVHTTAIGMGFGPAQLVWDTSGPVSCPYIRPWAPRFTYYHWPSRRYRALSQDGEIQIVPGDAKWLLHAPFGSYRGWIRGAIRAVAEPWLLRHFAFRDMARFSEVHGMPTRIGMVPAVSDPGERSAFETSLANLGSDAAMILPQGVDGQLGSGYDYKLVEARDRAWEVFPGLIDRCDMAIVLAMMFQNLTTEVKGGSFAATSAHMDIRQSGLQGDNQAWKQTIYEQIARPFAYLNFGDADLAPWTWWDVEPRDDLKGNAQQFKEFGYALEVLARGGIKFKNVEELRAFAAKKFGLDGLPDFEIGEAVVGGLGAKETSKLPFTQVDPAAVVTVDEARELNSLGPLPGGGGELTIQEFTAKNTAKHKPAAPAPKGDKPAPDAAGKGFGK
jgi:phage gp29-like protein